MRLLLPGSGDIYDRLVEVMDRRPAEKGLQPIKLDGIEWQPLINLRGEFIFLGGQWTGQLEVISGK